jgi:hypothetical protein
LKLLNERILSMREVSMHSSQRYRYKAAECLRTAQAARQLLYRRLYLSMAGSWLSLARRDEAIDEMRSEGAVHDETSRKVTRPGHG